MKKALSDVVINSKYREVYAIGEKISDTDVERIGPLLENLENVDAYYLKDGGKVLVAVHTFGSSFYYEGETIQFLIEKFNKANIPVSRN